MKPLLPDNIHANKIYLPNQDFSYFSRTSYSVKENKLSNRFDRFSGLLLKITKLNQYLIMLQISEWKICHFWLFSISVMVTDKCIKISNKQLTLSHCFWSRIDQEMCQFSKDITQCHQWQVPNILWWPIHDDDALSLPCLLVASNCLKRLCPRLNCDWMNLASWAVLTCVTANALKTSLLFTSNLKKPLTDTTGQVIRSHID